VEPAFFMQYRGAVRYRPIPMLSGVSVAIDMLSGVGVVWGVAYWRVGVVRLECRLCGVAVPPIGL